MPIANCFISPSCPLGKGNLVDIWANHSAQSSEHMTVNFIESKAQFGNEYFVMANLYLPSVWSSASISSIQIGLSKSLAEYFNITIDQVQVITSIVSSGMVVEDGQEIKW